MKERRVFPQGFSLVELLVALLLSSLITLLVVQLFINVKSHFSYWVKLLETEMDLFLTSNLIKDSIRRAGFAPCVGIGQLKIPSQQIQHLQPLVIENQRLFVRRMDEKFSLVSDILNAQELQLKEQLSLFEKQKVVVADCYHAEIAEVAKLIPLKKQIVLTKPLFFRYDSPFFIGPFINEEFFIRASRGLFYHFQRTEELNSELNSMSFHLMPRTFFSEINFELRLASTAQVFSVFRRNQ